MPNCTGAGVRPSIGVYVVEYEGRRIAVRQIDWLCGAKRKVRVSSSVVL